MDFLSQLQQQNAIIDGTEKSDLSARASSVGQGLSDRVQNIIDADPKLTKAQKSLELAGQVGDVASTLGADLGLVKHVKEVVEAKKALLKGKLNEGADKLKSKFSKTKTTSKTTTETSTKGEDYSDVFGDEAQDTATDTTTRAEPTSDFQDIFETEDAEPSLTGDVAGSSPESVSVRNTRFSADEAKGEELGDEGVSVPESTPSVAETRTTSRAGRMSAIGEDDTGADIAKQYKMATEGGEMEDLSSEAKDTADARPLAIGEEDTGADLAEQYNSMALRRGGGEMVEMGEGEASTTGSAVINPMADRAAPEVKQITPEDKTGELGESKAGAGEAGGEAEGVSSSLQGAESKITGVTTKSASATEEGAIAAGTTEAVEDEAVASGGGLDLFADAAIGATIIGGGIAELVSAFGSGKADREAKAKEGREQTRQIVAAKGQANYVQASAGGGQHLTASMGIVQTRPGQIQAGSGAF